MLLRTKDTKLFVREPEAAERVSSLPISAGQFSPLARRRLTEAASPLALLHQVAGHELGTNNPGILLNEDHLIINYDKSKVLVFSNKRQKYKWTIDSHELEQGKKQQQPTMKSSLVLTVLLTLLVAKLHRGYCIESLEQQMPSGVQTKKAQSKNLNTHMKFSTVGLEFEKGELAVEIGVLFSEYSTNPNLYKLPLSLLRRLYGGQGISYEALLRLSGKEEINPQTLASSQKRDMHDFFVGLMGKRTIEPGFMQE
ncbi:hypothetical protein Chor_012441 [Crotalus horridus]